MPKYTVTHPTTGKTITLTGTKPPSETELDDIFAQTADTPASTIQGNPDATAADTPFVTADGKVKTDNPQYRAGMEQFIRSQGARDLKQEAVRGLPFAGRIADAAFGQYNDPVHPERTVDRVLGKQVSPTTGGAMLSGVNRVITNPNESLTNLAHALPDLATGAYKAATSPESGSVSRFVKDTVTGIAAPTGLSDLAQGNMDFPQARQAWENDALGSGLMVLGVARGAAGATSSLADLGKTTATKTIGVVSDSVKPVADIVKNGVDTLRENSRQKFETQKLDSAIDTAYTKSVRPTIAGKKNINQIDNSIGNQRDAVKTIVENKDALNLDTANGLPSNLMEFSQAIKTAKDKVYKDYDAMKSATGEEGVTIDLTPIASELKSIADNKVLLDQKPQVAEYLKKRADVLNKRGSYTTAEMQDAVKIYNADLKAFYKNPSPQYAAQAAIDARIVDAMRKSLDEAITGEVGEGYQGLKNQYGALTSIEGEVAQRAIVDARKNPAGLLDFTDIATSGEALTGLLTGNPMMVIKGVAGRGIKEWIKNKNSPNTMIDNMFKTADKYYTRRQGVELPPVRNNYPKQPMVYDPSTGMQIPARNMPDARVPLNNYSPEPVNNTRPRVPLNNNGGGQPLMVYDQNLRQMVPRKM